MATLGPYELGPETRHPAHGIYYGDARRAVRLLPDASIPFVLWDPDYGVGMDYGAGAIGRDEALAFVVDLLPELRRVSSTGQAVVFWSGSVERVSAFLASPINDIWPVHYMGIWYKPNGAAVSGNGFSRRFETWFWLKDGDKPSTEWGRLPDVLSHNRVVPGHREAVGHPSQKPVDLLTRLIRFFTQPGDVVLDPTMGSGSAAVASVLTDRRYLGFELNAEYCRMARKRISATPRPLPLRVSEQMTLEVAAR